MVESTKSIEETKSFSQFSDKLENDDGDAEYFYNKEFVSKCKINES
jgi:hypothetical protein